MVQEGPSHGEVNARHLAVLEQIVDRARSEPELKERLVSDPQAAFSEASLLPDEVDPATADVVGQRKAGSDQQEYLVYTLQTSLISSIAIG